MEKQHEYWHYALDAREQANKAKSETEKLAWLRIADYLARAAATSRYKGRTSAQAIERDFPRIVEMAAPAN